MQEYISTSINLVGWAALVTECGASLVQPCILNTTAQTAKQGSMQLWGSGVARAVSAPSMCTWVGARVSRRRAATQNHHTFMAASERTTRVRLPALVRAPAR